MSLSQLLTVLALLAAFWLGSKVKGWLLVLVRLWRKYRFRPTLLVPLRPTDDSAPTDDRS